MNLDDLPPVDRDFAAALPAGDLATAERLLEGGAAINRVSCNRVFCVSRVGAGAVEYPTDDLAVSIVWATPARPPSKASTATVLMKYRIVTSPDVSVSLLATRPTLVDGSTNWRTSVSGSRGWSVMGRDSLRRLCGRARPGPAVMLSRSGRT